MKGNEPDSIVAVVRLRIFDSVNVTVQGFRGTDEHVLAENDHENWLYISDLKR
ncbi:hypothetical protein D3C74_497020 [compost metagenome]